MGYEDKDNLASTFVKANELAVKSDSGISTGYPELDGIIGRLQGGLVYLFYGDSSFVDELVHRLMVRACTVGKVGYMNNTDYYSEKTLVESDMLASLAKIEGMEPEIVFENVYFVAAYNELRQPKVANVFAEMICREPRTKLILIHNCSRFIANSKSCLNAIENVNKTLSLVLQLAARRNVPVVITAQESKKSKLAISKPFGSNWMRHAATIIVNFRDAGKKEVVFATLVKHPSKQTPASLAILKTNASERNKVGLTRYESSLDEDHRRAFQVLMREAWRREEAAIRFDRIPPIDMMNLTAAVFVRSEIERLQKKIERVAN